MQSESRVKLHMFYHQYGFDDQCSVFSPGVSKSVCKILSLFEGCTHTRRCVLTDVHVPVFRVSERERVRESCVICIIIISYSTWDKADLICVFIQSAVAIYYDQYQEEKLRKKCQLYLSY